MGFIEQGWGQEEGQVFEGLKEKECLRIRHPLKKSYKF
jgi:hypothetical protein